MTKSEGKKVLIILSIILVLFLINISLYFIGMTALKLLFNNDSLFAANIKTSQEQPVSGDDPSAPVDQPTKGQGPQVDEPQNVDEPKVDDRYNEVLSFEELLHVVIPEENLTRLGKVFEDSDGLYGDLAYVEPANRTGSIWDMAYDSADIYTKDGKQYLDLDETISTIVHEYAHIESLNESQVRHMDYRGSETEVVLDEGTAKEDSYINKFTKKFWTEEMMEAANEAYDKGSSEEFAYRNNIEHKGEFITEYAATNPAEDFAETFAAYVLKEKSDFNSTVLQQKYDFFDSFPEFVELKEKINDNIRPLLEQNDDDI